MKNEILKKTCTINFDTYKIEQFFKSIPRTSFRVDLSVKHKKWMSIIATSCIEAVFCD